MALPFDLTNIEVILELPGKCHYSSKTGWVTHNKGPYSDGSCKCIGGHIGGPLEKQIAIERKAEIEEKRNDLYRKYSSPEYFEWLKSINDAIKSYDIPILIDTSTYELPRLNDDLLDQGYNFVSKDRKNWYLVRNPSWNDYQYFMFA